MSGWWGLLTLALVAAGVPARANVRVVATIFPLTDLVRQIGGSAVDASTLLAAGANPHTYEPTPGQMRDVAQAALIVEVGAGLDAWVRKLLDARAGQAGVVTVTDGVSLLSVADDGHGDAPGSDPHIWLDPILVRDHVVPALTAALVKADPTRRADWERNAGSLRDSLTGLDAELRQILKPVEGKSYLALHSAWRYFAKRYGLREAAVIEPFPGKEPSAREMAEIVQAAQRVQAKVLLIEPQFNPRMAEQIARELGGRVVTVDPFGGQGVANRDSYQNLLRYNARVLAEALQ